MATLSPGSDPGQDNIWARLFNPRQTAHSPNLKTGEKVLYLLFSAIVGCCTAFIAHGIYHGVHYWRKRKITILDSQKLPEKEQIKTSTIANELLSEKPLPAGPSSVTDKGKIQGSEKPLPLGPLSVTEDKGKIEVPESLPKPEELSGKPIDIQGDKEKGFVDSALIGALTSIEPGETGQFALMQMPPVSDKILHQIHGTSFGKDSELEGANSVQILSYSLHYIKQRSVTVSPQLQQTYQQITDQLSGALEIANVSDPDAYVHLVQNKIKEAFSQSSSLLLPGGWIEKPSGHAMYYEVIPELGGTCTFRLYNLGAGIDAHESLGHGKILPFLEWRGIARSRLEDPVTLQALYEMKHYREDPVAKELDTNYRQEDIYDSLKELLAPVEEGIHQVESQSLVFKSRQTIGNCTWKSIEAYLATHLPEKEYKQLVMNLKIQTIYDAAMDTSQTGAMHINLLEKAVKHTGDYMAKQIQQKRLPPSFLESAFKPLEEAQKAIQAKKHTFSKKPAPHPSFPDHALTVPLPPAEPALIEQVDKGGIAQEKGISMGVTEGACAILKEIEGIGPPDPGKIDAQLTSLQNIMNKHWKANSFAVQSGVVQFLSQMSPDVVQKMLKNRSIDDGKQLMEQLGEISRLFFLTCANVPSPNQMQPERIYALVKLFYLQTLTFKQCWPEYPPIFTLDLRGDVASLGVRDLCGSYFALKDRYMSEEMSLMIKEIETHGNRTLQMASDRYVWFAYFKKEGTPSFVKLVKEKELSFYQKIKSDPKLANASEEQVFAYLLASPDCPNWLKAFRNSSLYLTAISGPYQFKSDLDALLNKDVEVSIIETNKEYFQVKFSIPVIEQQGYGSSLFFQNLYRPFKQEKMTPVVTDVNLISHLSQECNLLSLSASDYRSGMSNEEFRSFARMFPSDNVGLIDLLAYGKEHPLCLADPDFRLIFQRLILARAPKSSQESIRHVANWFQEQHIRFLAQGENYGMASVFALHMLRTLKQIAPEAIELKDHMKNLCRILDQPLTSTDRSWVYAELIAYLGTKATLTDEEIALLLEGSCHLAQIPLAKEETDPLLLYEVDKTRLVHGATALYWLKKDKKRIDEVLGKIFPDLPSQSWRWEGDCFVSDNARYEPLNGSFFSTFSHNYNQKVFLPTTIREHEDFKKLFPSVNQATIMVRDITKAGVIPYQFTDPLTKRRTIVCLKGNRLLIEQQFDPNDSTSWCRFIAKDLFFRSTEDNIQNCLQNMHMVHQCSHWRPVKNPRQICIQQESTKKITHEVVSSTDNFDPKNSTVKRLSDQLLSSQAPPVFQALEHPQFVQSWSDENGQLKKVEMTRFGLSFSVKNNVAHCDQLPGYFIRLDKEHVQIPYQYPHGCVLENDKGQKKLLLPHLAFKKPKQQESLLSRFDVDYRFDQMDEKTFSYFTYDLDKDNVPTANTPESEVYLATVYAFTQDYEKAAQILKKQVGHLINYQDLRSRAIVSMLEQLRDITDIVGGNDPNAAVIQTHAGYLWIKNQLLYRKGKIDELAEKVYQEWIDKTTQSYAQCLRKPYRVNVAPLDKEEELFLLKTLDKNHPLLQSRCQLLLGKSPIVQTTSLVAPQSKSRQGLPSADLLLSTLEKSGPSFPVQPFSSKNLLVTRFAIQNRISSQFTSLYQLSLDNDPSHIKDKQWLKSALIFAKRTDSVSNEERSLAQFLLYVIDNPNHFKRLLDPATVPIKDSNGKLHKLWQEWSASQIKSAKALSKAASPSQSPPPPVASQQIALPPNYEVLRPSAAKIDKVQPKFALPQSSELVNDKDKEALFTLTARPPVNLEGLKDFLKKDKPSSPVEQAEFSRLEKDLESYESRSVNFKFTIKDTEKIQQILQEDPKVTEKLQSWEKEILSLANVSYSNLPAAQAKRLQLLRKQIKPLTLEEIIVNFARQSPGDLQERNPALSTEQIQKLYELIGKFVVHKTQDQQRLRALKAWESLGKAKARSPADPAEIAEMTQTFAENMLTRRNYKLQEPTPATCAYLVFEYFMDMRLRPAQIEKLTDLLENSAVKNPIMEMIMGSGKSKVLLPLLGLLRANGKQLSLLIVSPSFFKDVSRNTHGILDRAFGQSLKTIHFERSTKLSEEVLEEILLDMESIRSQRNCLIMTNKSLVCLKLKLLEEWQVHKKNSKPGDPLPRKIELIGQILLKLYHEAPPLIDEVDTVLNVRRDVSFSMGEKASLPSAALLQTMHLYKILYMEIGTKYRLESNPLETSAPALTEKVYHSTVKKEVAKQFLSISDQIEYEEPAIRKGMRTLKALSSQKKEALINFLCRDQDLTTEQHGQAQLAFDELPSSIKGNIALASGQIGHIFGTTLTKFSDERYGIVGNALSATPFIAAGVPSIGSEFTPYITLSYTIQGYVKKGIPMNKMREELENVMQQLDKCAQDSGYHKLMTKWGGRLGVSLKNVDNKHWEQVAEKLNANTEWRLEFLQEFLLPKLNFYTEKIASNPQNLISMFQSTSGFTGTLWNALSMHHHLSPVPEAGTDSVTLSLLWANQSSVLVIPSENPDLIYPILKDHNIDMVADAGGYFKKLSNLEAARQMAKRMGKPVVFYHNNEQTITDGDGEKALKDTNIPPEERLTFLDQVNTIGADVPQKTTAVAIVTIGQHMLLRDLLQAVWRLRGLDKGQKVRFLVSAQVATAIRTTLGITDPNSTIGLQEILRFVIHNQAEQQGKDNFRAFCKQEHNVIQQLLIECLLGNLSVSEKEKAFTELHHYWITSESLSPEKQYGKLPAEKKAMDEVPVQAKATKDMISAHFAEGARRKAALDEVDEITKHFSDPAFFPELVSGEIDEDQTSEVEREMEAETEKETEKDVQIEKEVETEVDKLDKHFILCKYPNEKFERIDLQKTSIPHSDGKSQPFFSFADYMRQTKTWSKYATAFEGVDSALNFFEFTFDYSRKNGYKPNDLTLFGLYQKPVDDLAPNLGPNLSRTLCYPVVYFFFISPFKFIWGQTI